MLRRALLMLSCSFLLGVSTAESHFIWLDLQPDASGQLQARIYFGEQPEPSEPRLIGKIAHAKLWVRGADGEDQELKLSPPAAEQAVLLADCPQQPATSLEASCDYGIYQRGPAGLLLQYYAKHLDGKAMQRGEPLTHSRRLALDIVPALVDGQLRIQVLYRDKPSPGSEVVLIGPTGEQRDLKTDLEGRVTTAAGASGRYAVRAAYIEPDRSGDRDGTKFNQTWHYSTLTLDIPAKEADKMAEMPAKELLKRARDGRAMWKDFPGFTADLAVSSGGTQATGTVSIESSGAVSIEMPKSPLSDWAEEQLNSLVQHRMPDGEVTEGKVIYSADDAGHPLGRKIELGEKLESGYRIKDDVIMEVNRSLGKQRFTISVLEIIRNPEGKYLPRSFTMNFFDAGSGQLQTSVEYWNDWQRLGAFDLPKTILEVSAHKGSETRQIVFNNCCLLGQK